MPTSRGYKALTLQEIQCLSETGRLGSLMAAAGSLNLSHPTVWKQVHALERFLGVPLVETHARGCYLTAAGHLLVEMIGPAMESFTTLQERFHAALYPAFWVRGLDLSDEAVLRGVLEEAGLDAAALLQAAGAPEAKQALRETTEEAVARGVFGAPTFFVGDEMFFGADRLPFVERALADGVD